MPRTYEYSALKLTQTEAGKPVLLFAAPAVDISAWAGIPQKKRFDESDTESIGFQREQNEGRIDSLKEFFANEENVIQNPLLCATRILDPSVIEFVPSSDNTAAKFGEFGKLRITSSDLSDVPFQQLFGLVRSYLESRVPDLVNRKPSDKLITELKERARKNGQMHNDESAVNEVAEAEDDTTSDSEDEASIAGVLFEESHILDFWDEIAARDEVAKMIQDPLLEDEFLGFSREGLASYVLPVVLVDGQHRLRGALAAAEDKVNQGDLKTEVETRVLAGEDPDVVQMHLLTKASRMLPISLLLSDDPAEQVFQFVVVNQKATPIGRALLGTIVSTTLAKDEMEKVAVRLKGAGIKLEESQAITYLARHPSSPFAGLVERGLAGDGSDLLQWNVFSSLIAIFRNLKGGKLYGEKNDYADRWRKKYLIDSPIVASYTDENCTDVYEYWSRFDGPWREVFIAFWTAVSTKFGTRKDSEAPNCWGKTRQSNLFNKISLTILSADFFQYLIESRTTITSANQITDLVNDWLEEVDENYFNRDWNLAGTKKDSSGIRNQWASLWKEYRKNPERLPQTRQYRQPKAE